MGEGYWKWELERRLAVARWQREDDDMAAADARIEAERAPVMEMRKRQLARREQEAAQMRGGLLSPDAVAERLQRIAAEDQEWQGYTANWEGVDQLRLLRREQNEGRRSAEIERWLDENAWELVNLNMDLPVQRRLLQ